MNGSNTTTTNGAEERRPRAKDRTSWLGYNLARRELKRIIAQNWYSNSISQEKRQRKEQSTLKLLKRYPKLAQQGFARKEGWSKRLKRKRIMSPLSFLVELGANVSTVQQVCELVPDVVPARDYVVLYPRSNTGNSREPGDYPLHRACQLGRVSDQVVIYLARKYPQHVSARGTDGYLPLHALLRNPTRSATLQEVQTLLDIHPDAIQDDCGFGTPVVLACKSSHTTPDVLEELTQQYSENQFQLGGVVAEAFGARYVERNDGRISFNLSQAQTVSLMLPRLKTFTCLPRDWHFNAFQHVMRELNHQKQLKDLSLHLPCSLFWDNKEAFDAIQQLLEQNTVLECLHLDFGNDNNDNGFGYKWIRTCLVRVVSGLCQNHSLQECHLSGGILARLPMDFYRKKFFGPLSMVLQESNLSLQWISIAPLMCMLPEEGTQVLYWTRLNRFGRAKARDPSLDNRELGELLVKANDWLESAEHASFENDPINVLFGLLRECPSVWAS
ncbi:expressed unknown protein [Seminavis robusta]|uniref:Uncharacterized protein n=1 Tax=Seminavis robusta TaxID=568900 RepID=A0A9N8DRT9_9STRA|nr:expressed unknown protein [Seminavis robusta]|eukprot:Sro295_g110440.1 n/a (500) ;mRNA; r:32404-33903